MIAHYRHTTNHGSHGSTAIVYMKPSLPTQCLHPYQTLVATLVPRSIGDLPRITLTYTVCKLKAMAHEPLTTLQERRVSHWSCAATTLACNDGVLDGLNACAIGSVKPNTPNHTTHSRTQPKCVPSNTLRPIAKYFDNAQEHHQRCGY